MVIDAAMFIPNDQEQGLLPQWRVPHRFVYICDQHISEANVVIRVLIVRLFESEVEIAGFNEAVARDGPVSRVFRELMKEPESILECVHAKPLEGKGLRNVVKKDFPGAARVLQAMIDGVDIIVV